MALVSSLPHASDHHRELRAQLLSSPSLAVLDFDGTLTPIVDHPGDAVFGEDRRDVLRALAARLPVAILSGRARKDVAARVGIEGLVYAGCHGFDIQGPAMRFVHEEGERRRGDLAAAAAALAARFEAKAIGGTFIEDKAYAVSVHYRHVAEAERDDVVQAVLDEAVRRGLKSKHGKRVVELGPDVDWHKGRALGWLRHELAAHEGQPRRALFIGDDVTDEDALREVADEGAGGIGIVVADGDRETAARYRLRNPDEVLALLAQLAEE